MEEIKGWLVHTVYKIYSSKIYYIKIRGTSFAKLPNFIIDPSKIKYEKKAIKIFLKMLPDIFPSIIDFNKKLSALIITDTIVSGGTLYNLLINNKINKFIIKDIGDAVSKNHFSLNKIKTSIRPNKDKDQYKNNFNNRLLTFDYPLVSTRITNLTKKLNKLPKRLIIADLSPKNIGVSESGKISFFDLSFFLGHINLHSKNKSDHKNIK